MLLLAAVNAAAIMIATSHASLPASDDQSDDSVSTRLSSRLLRRSNKHIRPVRHPNTTLVVHVSSALYQIVDLDQRNNLATISAYFDLFWYDDRLKWDPNDFNGVKNTYLPSDLVWTPELFLYHSIKGSKALYFKEMVGQVDYKGRVRIFMPFTARALCPINVKYFPFDTQVCKFTFGSWTYKRESVEFAVETPYVFLGDFYDNQEWLLTESDLRPGVSHYSTAAAKETYSMVTMTLTIQRQSFYYVFNLVIPIVLVSLVAAIGFHAPGNSSSQRREAKFRLGIMTLLSMSVMLLMLVDEMPKFALESIPGQRGSFSDVPLLGLFYITLIVLVSVCTCTSSLFIHLERYARRHRRFDSIPCCLQWLAKKSSSPLGCQRGRRPFKSSFGAARPQLGPDNIPEEKAAMCPSIDVATKTAVESPIDLSEDTNRFRLSRTCTHPQECESDASAAAVKRTAAVIVDRLDEVAQHLQANLDWRHDVAAEECVPEHWERVIRRLEMLSLTFYLGAIALSIFMFYKPFWWY